MGLFDGPHGAPGSTADLAAALRLPVVLVLDVARQGQSVAALARGFSDFRPDIEVAGVILNRVGSERHRDRCCCAALDEAACASSAPSRARPRWPCPNAISASSRPPSIPTSKPSCPPPPPSSPAPSTSRRSAAPPGRCPPGEPAAPLPPLGQRIALADDPAFGFAYRHLLSGWRAAGAEIVPFSPLADEPPDASADAVFLPGGYPELHAGRLAGNRRFLDGLARRARRGALIYGECGGFMVLGEHLIDAGATPMPWPAWCRSPPPLPRRLSLGYREMRHAGALPFPASLRGHEFHYSTLVSQGAGEPLFEVRDAAGHHLPPAGLQGSAASWAPISTSSTEPTLSA
jgi:cobyrinic acid a,c-diamide synthase